MILDSAAPPTRAAAPVPAGAPAAPVPAAAPAAARQSSLQIPNLQVATAGNIPDAIREQISRNISQQPDLSSTNLSPAAQAIAAGIEKTQKPTTNAAEKVPTTPRTDDQQLGFMAKQYESGKMGTSAIGFDKTGGSSYGAYQIATKTGTMDRFMSYLKENNPEAYERLSQAGDPNVAGGGKFGKEWKKLAEEGKLQTSEKDFIKKTHYDVGMGKVKDENLQKMIGDSQALQEVMWSTSVQHGGGGAGQIFNKVYKPGMSQEDLIKGIYAERGTKFSSSTPEVQQSVLNRFQKEQQQALNLTKQPPSTTSEQIKATANKIVPQTDNTIPEPTERTTGAAIESRAQELSMNKEAAAATPPVIAPNTTNITNVNNSTGGGGRVIASIRNEDPTFIKMQMTSSLYQVS